MSSKISDISFNSKDGKATNLANYKGDVVLVVNVASKCGLTPQYEALQKIYETYHDKGFTILAFPANEFGAQEPGSNAEIQEFCQLNYGVTFPVLEKIVVKGEGQHALYKELTTLKPNAIKVPDSSLVKTLEKHGLLTGKSEDIMWNFEKFLIGRDGMVIERFAPDIAPLDPVLKSAIEKAL